MPQVARAGAFVSIDSAGVLRIERGYVRPEDEPPVAAAAEDERAGGDADVPFSIQSISKVFTLTLALGMVGDRLWRHVGREPSGNPFNSIVQLERERGVPRNPFINAGAIAVTDVILSGHQPREAIGEILRFMQFLAGDPSIVID